MTALVFSLALLFFAAGMSGSIPVYRDSGDLIASVSTLGIPHPPGYPLYALAAKLFQSLIPFGNPSYKLNLFSAFCAAAMLALLYKTLSRYSRFAACGAVLVFAMSPALGMLGRVSEMYTLAVLLSVLMFTLAMSNTPQTFVASFFVLGLAMGVHPTLILLAPALWFATQERKWNGLPGISALLFFLVGFSIVLYLPVRALTHPALNWGNPSTLRNFWRVLTRADYGGWKLHPVESTAAWTPAGIIAQLAFFMRALAGEWGWAALLMACGGILAAFKQTEKTRCLWGACLSFILVGPFFFLLSNLPLQEATTPAILQPYLLLPGVFIAAAFAYCLSQLWRKQKSLAVLGLVVGLSTAPHTGGSFHARQDFLAYDYGRNLLRALPRNAVLYDPDDPTSFTVRALQVTENRRLDILPLNFFRTRWGYEDLRARTTLLPDIPIANAQELQHILWTYSRLRQPFYAELPQKFEARPYASEGLVYAAYPENFRVSLARAEANLQMLVRRDFSQTTDHADFFARHVVSYYAAAQCNLGLDDANAGLSERAAFHYQYALAIDPTLTVAYNNWGNLMYQRRNYLEAIALYRAGLALDPTDTGLHANLRIALSAVAPAAAN